MFATRRAARRLAAAGGALLLAGPPLTAHAGGPWSSTIAGVTTLTYQAGAGLNLSPLACSPSFGTFTATLTVSLVTLTAQYNGPATINASFTSNPGSCSTMESGFGSLSSATMSGSDGRGNFVSCDLSLGGFAAMPGNPSGYALWDFFGPNNGPVQCSINGQPAGTFGIGAEGQQVVTGVSSSNLQATEVQMVGGLNFGSTS